jgi:acetyl-CoA carboxylase biotin carboxyl carrier protein
MNQEQIKMLIDAFAASDLSTLEFSENGCTLRLARQGAAPLATAPAPFPAASTEAAAAAAIEAADVTVPPSPSPSPSPSSSPAPAADVLAPLYGVVHLRPAPGEPCFVEAGQRVEAGQTLCVVEAMKVFNEVHAPRGATIESVLVESGQEVDAGQALFRLG